MVVPRPVFEVDLDRDVRTVVAMAERLTPYIYEDELYGLMPGDLPRLTVGGLLMRLHRLDALPDLLSASQREAVQAARQKFDEVRREWAVAYEKKVLHELKARLTAIGQFVRECSEAPRACAENYPSQMEKRVIAELLKGEAQAHGFWSDSLDGSLLALDNEIRRITDKSDFCWDARVAAAYPQEVFWFLYLVPKRPTQ